MSCVRSKHVETSINFGIINSITKLHLVGISTESFTMHGSMNIKQEKYPQRHAPVRNYKSVRRHTFYYILHAKQLSSKHVLLKDNKSSFFLHSFMMFDYQMFS